MRPLTRPCFLLSLLDRQSLLALPYLLGTCLPSLWSSPFLLHAPALISLSLAKVRLSLTLTISHLTIWCFGLMALFFLPLVKAGLAFMSTAPSVALRPLFSAGPDAQVFQLKPMPFCKLFASLSSTNKSVSSLFSDCCSVPATLSSTASFFFPQSLSQKLSSLSSCFIKLQWIPGHSFLSGKRRS